MADRAAANVHARGSPGQQLGGGWPGPGRRVEPQETPKLPRSGRRQQWAWPSAARSPLQPPERVWGCGGVSLRPSAPPPGDGGPSRSMSLPRPQRRGRAGAQRLGHRTPAARLPNSEPRRPSPLWKQVLCQARFADAFSQPVAHRRTRENLSALGLGKHFLNVTREGQAVRVHAAKRRPRDARPSPPKAPGGAGPGAQAARLSRAAPGAGMRWARMRGAEPPAACVEGPLAAGLAPEATGGDARCSTLPGGLSRSSSYLTHAPKTGVTITAKCLCKARSGAPPQGRPLEDRAHTAPRHREAPSPQPPRAALPGRGQLGARLPLLGLPRPISAPPGQEKSRRALRPTGSCQ